ncbi:MAG: tetratricopeptide (TPR) repeat protein [Planctomycetota bacterium]|jgi:tetratricopeptide (TPR) repeat protein
MKGRNFHHGRWGLSIGRLGGVLRRGLPCALSACLAGACAGTGEGWEARLELAQEPLPGHEAPDDRRPVDVNVLPFALWLPVKARGDYSAPLHLAHELTLAGDVDGALEIVTHLIEEHPGEAGPLAARAALHHMLGFSRAAEHELTRAFAMDPGDGAIAFCLAKLRLELGCPTAALEALGYAQNSGRDDAELHHLLGRTFVLLGRGPAARRHFEAAFDRAGRELLEYYLTIAKEMLSGKNSLHTGEEAEAWIAGVLDRAHFLAPMRADIWLLRGQFHERQGSSEQALVAFEQACEAEPQNRLAWTHLALASREARDRERFGRAITRVLALESNQLRVRRLMELAGTVEPEVVLLENH